MDKIAIVCHGGAWAIPDHLVDASRAGVEEAARAGWAVLSKGGSALDAVEAAVVVLENNPAFDAGCGSVLTDSGEVEMDAFIMDGENLNVGTIGAVSNIKNPVKLARYVMEETEHTMIVGKGADQLAERSGLELADKDYLVTPEGLREWETYKRYSHAVGSLFSQRGHDTVGAVALDSSGKMAAATSTGGITGKMNGRVGDTPLVGAGGHADDQVGCISTTGHGESITKCSLALTASSLLKAGKSPREAGKDSLDYMYKRVGGSGGLIIIDSNGMVHSGLEPEEHFSKQV